AVLEFQPIGPLHIALAGRCVLRNDPAVVQERSGGGGWVGSRQQTDDPESRPSGRPLHYRHRLRRNVLERLPVALTHKLYEEIQFAVSLPSNCVMRRFPLANWRTRQRSHVPYGVRSVGGRGYGDAWSALFIAKDDVHCALS